MSNPADETERGDGRDQVMSALFASMVMQSTNMALIFLGQAPNPQTGQTSQDLEHAKYFIDQLEMLAVKTKGNLDKQEDALLKQSLTHLRLAFVEAVEHPPKTDAPAATTPAAPPVDEQETPVVEPILPGEKTAETETRKKFSKTY
jgi:Domain of unknown function (DUF1844)